MKRILFHLILLFTAETAIATNDCIWEPSEKYEHFSKYELALNSAKTWVSENRTKGSEKCIVEFKVSDHQNGYYVSLNFLIENERGDRWFTAGNHNALYMNSDGIIYDVFFGA